MAHVQHCVIPGTLVTVITDSRKLWKLTENNAVYWQLSNHAQEQAVLNKIQACICSALLIHSPARLLNLLLLMFTARYFHFYALFLVI